MQVLSLDTHQIRSEQLTVLRTVGFLKNIAVPVYLVGHTGQENITLGTYS